MLARAQRIIGLHVTEDGRFHRVIILLRDRIELVVVAARTLNGQSQHALAYRANHIVQVVVAPCRIGVFMIPDARTRAQEAGGDQAVIGPVGNLVAGDLFLYKSVVGLVFIEGP